MLWVLDLDPILRCPGPIAALAMLRYRPRTRPPLPRGHMHSLMRTRLIQRDPRIAVIQHPLRCVCGAGVKALQTFRPTVWPDGFDEVACAGFQRLDIEHRTSSRHRKPWEAILAASNPSRSDHTPEAICCPARAAPRWGLPTGGRCELRTPNPYRRSTGI
jgi:hypothetical protein